MVYLGLQNTIQPKTIGGVTPVKSDQRDVFSLATELVRSKVNNTPITAIPTKYATLVPKSQEDAVALASNVISGSGKNEMIKHYSKLGYTKEMVGGFHDYYGDLSGETTPAKDTTKSDNIKTLVIAEGTIGAGATFSLGKAMEHGGKKLYSLTTPENEVTADKIINSYDKPVKGNTVMETAYKTGGPFSITGGPVGMGKSASYQSNKIFNKILNPIFGELDTGPKLSMGIIGNNAEQTINGMDGIDNLTKKSIVSTIKGYIKNYQTQIGDKINYTEAKNLKSGIYDFISNKVKKGIIGKNIGDTSARLIADELLSNIHTTIKSKYGVDSANLFGDRWNLQSIKETGKASLRKRELQSALGVTSALIQRLGTPLASLGKPIARAGKALQKLSQIPKVKRAIEGVVGVIKTINKNKAFIKGKNVLSAVNKGLDFASPAIDAVMITDYLEKHPKMMEKVANIGPDKRALAKFLGANMKERDKAHGK